MGLITELKTEKSTFVDYWSPNKGTVSLVKSSLKA